MRFDLLRAILVVLHVGLASVWLGAMVYSLAVVQPRAERFLGGAPRYEGFAVTLAAGARWKVLGLCAGLLASGVGLIAIQLSAHGGASTLWYLLVAVKAVLLVSAVALFAHVSWRLWPARLFALESELPVLQRRFRAVAPSR